MAESKYKLRKARRLKGEPAQARSTMPWWIRLWTRDDLNPIYGPFFDLRYGKEDYSVYSDARIAAMERKQLYPSTVKLVA